MACNLLIHGVYWGYNPFTNLLLTSWDIQVSLRTLQLDPVEHTPEDPWDWYIYLHEWLIFVVNVGIYTIHGSFGYPRPEATCLWFGNPSFQMDFWETFGNILGMFQGLLELS